MAKHDLQKVMKIGEELFRTKGYFHTGTEEILEKASFPRSSFYHHFKNKEGYVIRIIESYGKEFEDLYQHILGDTKTESCRKRFETLFDAIMHVGTESDFKLQCLLQKMARECAGENEPIRISTEKELNKLINKFEACILEGQEKGEFRNNMEPHDMAQFLHSQMYGSYILARLSQRIDPMQKNLSFALDAISA